MGYSHCWEAMSISGSAVKSSVFVCALSGHFFNLFPSPRVFLLITAGLSCFGSILMANPLETGKMSISAVLGHAVQDVEIVTEADDEMKRKLAHLFVPGESQTYTQEELVRKKNSLKSWLEANHIPVQEQGESQPTLCVAGVLTIDPPYGPDDCNSSNEIILSRIQGLVQGYLAGQQ